MYCLTQLVVNEYHPLNMQRGSLRRRSGLPPAARQPALARPHAGSARGPRANTSRYNQTALHHPTVTRALFLINTISSLTTSNKFTMTKNSIKLNKIKSILHFAWLIVFDEVSLVERNPYK